MITRKHSRSWSKSLLVVSGLFLTFCAHDTYQQRADLVKDHSEAFYTHLKANRVEAAIRENEQIEAMASEMGQTVRKRVAQQGTTSVEREFALMKTANEAAATNWLALGQYFAIKKQYPQARATYQRVLNTYNNPTDRQYRDQAARALQDLNILNPPSASVTNP
jgi:tetratricopeptide (TPR) repeat protein